MLNLLDKDILHEAADSIRAHNQIHNKKERNAVFITNYLDFAAELIDLLADDKIVIVKHGRWIETKYNPIGDTMYCDCKCSSCNFQITGECGQYPKFCENCGVKMSGGTDNV